MFELSTNNIITLSRGDSFECSLFLNAGTDVCPVQHTLKKVIDDSALVDQEYVVFALMQPNQCFDNALVRKTFNTENLNDDGDVVIKLESKDTRNLCPGNYHYEIKAYLFETDNVDDSNVITSDEIKGEIINTVVEKTKFIII